MDNITIRPCTMAEIELASNFAAIVSEYAAETAIDGMPRHDPSMEIYKALDASRDFHTIAAFSGNTLIGFITVISTLLPHYSTRISSTESFFVPKIYRSTGVGLNLLAEAERYAQGTGSAGVLISAPIAGKLAELLPLVGYKNTNLLFFKRFDNA